MEGMEESEAIGYAEVLTKRWVSVGCCPRCGSGLPKPPVSPAGSRVTACRCIPICGTCGEHEALSTTSPSEWPLDPEDVREQMAQWLATGTSSLALLAPEGDDCYCVVDGDGVTPVRPRQHPGGWAEFGPDH